MGNKRTLAFIAILFTTVVWGISFLSIKVAVDVLPPMTLSFLRFVLASIILFVAFKLKEPKTKLEKEDFPRMIISGIFGLTLYFYFENTGVKLTTASTAAIIIAILPVLTVIVDAIAFGYKLNLMKIIGVLFSVFGVCLVVNANVNEMGGSFAGYLFMLGAAVSWVVYSFLTKPLTKKYSELAVAFYQMIFGTITLIPSMFIEKTDWSRVTTPIILNVLFLGIICSALANFLYVYSMENLGVSLTSMFMNVLPLITVITSYFVLGERIGIKQVIGGITVVAAVYLVSYERKSTDNESKTSTR